MGSYWKNGIKYTALTNKVEDAKIVMKYKLKRKDDELYNILFEDENSEPDYVSKISENYNSEKSKELLTDYGNKEINDKDTFCNRLVPPTLLLLCLIAVLVLIMNNAECNTTLEIGHDPWGGGRPEIKVIVEED